MQVYKNLAVIPLYVTENGSPAYITLKESLERGTLTLSEREEIGNMSGFKQRRGYTK
jgi:hypothetical protein